MLNLWVNIANRPRLLLYTHSGGRGGSERLLSTSLAVPAANETVPEPLGKPKFRLTKPLVGGEGGSYIKIYILQVLVMRHYLLIRDWLFVPFSLWSLKSVVKTSHLSKEKEGDSSVEKRQRDTVSERRLMVKSGRPIQLDCRVDAGRNESESRGNALGAIREGGRATPNMYRWNRNPRSGPLLPTAVFASSRLQNCPSGLIRIGDKGQERGVLTKKAPDIYSRMGR